MSDLPFLSLRDRLGVAFDVVLPSVAKGAIARRPLMMRLADRFQWDARGVRRLRAIRDKYGDGPVVLRLLTKRQAIVLTHEHALRVLEETPYPFSTASFEKVSALGHFEPKNSLVSENGERRSRRQLSEKVLQPECRRHSLEARFTVAAGEEMERLLQSNRHMLRDLDWSTFSPAWDRVVRRVVLGDAAAGDVGLSADLLALRKAGNWAFMHPLRRRRLDRFRSRLHHYLERREPGSLASRVPANLDDQQSAPLDQYTHYLFAFDAAGLAILRALAVIAARPRVLEKARAAADGANGGIDDAYLRGCIVEALRLWPTTILILRETRAETNWPNGTLPSGYGVWIVSSFFHRDEQRLEGAHDFRPELWTSERPVPGLALVPFSDGPGMCPGRHVVQATAGAALGTLISQVTPVLRHPERVGMEGPLPMTLDHTSLRFGLASWVGPRTENSTALAVRIDERGLARS